MPESNLRTAQEVLDTAEWQNAIQRAFADTEYELSAQQRLRGLENAMWAAYKMGYMRCRQELQSTDMHFPQSLRHAHIGVMTREDEINVEQLIDILATEPRFEP